MFKLIFYASAFCNRVCAIRTMCCVIFSANATRQNSIHAFKVKLAIEANNLFRYATRFRDVTRIQLKTVHMTYLTKEWNWILYFQQFTEFQGRFFFLLLFLFRKKIIFLSAKAYFVWQRERKNRIIEDLWTGRDYDGRKQTRKKLSVNSHFAGNGFVFSNAFVNM